MRWVTTTASRPPGRGVVTAACGGADEVSEGETRAKRRARRHVWRDEAMARCRRRRVWRDEVVVVAFGGGLRTGIPADIVEGG